MERRSPIQGKRIRERNGLVLVEWHDGDRPRRNWVLPVMIDDELDDKQVLVINPGAGVPYGLDFSRLVTLQATADDLDRELKRRNIWTVEDVRARSNEIRGALQAAYGVDLAAFMLAIRSFEKSTEVV